MSATIALQSAVHHFGRLDGAGTVEWCRRALELAGPDGAVGRTARTYLAHGLGYLGRVADAFAAVEGVGGAEGDADDPEVGWLQPRSARGVLRLVEDDLDGARADLAAVGNRAYELGILNIAAFALGYLARAEYLAGAWDDAVGHAERAVAVNDEADWGFTWSTVVGIAVLVPAARGEWAAAEAALEGAAGRYPGGYERSVVAVAMSRARLAEARGDAAGMVAALEPVRSFPIRDGVDEPGFWAWQDLYAEGLVGVGRGEEADELLRAHEERAAQRGRASSVARLARARGRVEAALGRPERAAEAFEQALDAAGRVALPFERAKVELAAGGFLRRVGRRRRAAELLTAALATFERLGARPYAERCRTELAGSGLQPAPRGGRGSLLTSQELVVARLAAAGRTNREIAAELVVSVKTVEYHLRNVFQKLGVDPAPAAGCPVDRAAIGVGGHPTCRSRPSRSHRAHRVRVHPGRPAARDHPHDDQRRDQGDRGVARRAAVEHPGGRHRGAADPLGRRRRHPRGEAGEGRAGDGRRRRVTGSGPRPHPFR